MHDIAVRLLSTLLSSGVLLFVAFFMLSICILGKLLRRLRAGIAGPPPAAKDYGRLAPVARPLE